MAKQSTPPGEPSRRNQPRPADLRRQAARRRKQQQRFLLIGLGGVLVVLVLVFVIVKLTSGSSTSNQKATAAGPVPAAVVSQVASVPLSDMAAAAKSAPASVVAPSAISGTPLALHGKPQILYIGAEYCPYCAATRWGMVVALSKFGSFTGLGSTHSSTTDVYPGTQTFSFHGATYTSKYLSFTGVEETTNQPNGNGYVALDTPTAAQQKLVQTYDTTGSIPFIDFGGKYLLSSSAYSPSVLAGLNMATIASEINDPATAVGKAVDASAGKFVTTLCHLTSGQPSNVCKPFTG